MSEPRFLVACSPKSGSTFLSKALAVYLSVKKISVNISGEVQELSSEKMQKFGDAGFVGQSHCIPTKYNMALIKAQGLQVIVLERSIMDAIASMTDNLNERIKAPAGVMVGALVSQFGYWDTKFLALDRSQQFDYVIDNVVGWYLKFHIAWRSSYITDQIPIHFARYETIFPALESEFKNLLIELHLFDEEAWQNYSFPGKEPGSAGVRFNVGRSGRGKELLSKAQQEKIQQIARTFKIANDCDLSDIL